MKTAKIIFGLVFLIVLSGTISLVQSAPSIISPCSKNCRAELDSEIQYCELDAKYSSEFCRYEYDYCLDLANNNKNKIKKCKEEYKSCLKESNTIKKECRNNAKTQHKECLNFCRQKTCPDIYEPVCGVDRITYQNLCYLKKAGIKKAYDGECKKYCYSDFDCLENEFCEFPEGWCGGIIDYEAQDLLSCSGKTECIPPFEFGNCIKKPEICIDIYEPVCGCNGITYSNECEMMSEKVSLAYRGECEVNCYDLQNKINKEIVNIQKCSKDSECTIDFLNIPCSLFLMCGVTFNKNADLTQLNKLSEEYKEKCSIEEICPMLACIDPKHQNAKCINNQCMIFLSF